MVALQGSHMSLQDLVQFIYHWSTDQSQTQTMTEIDISRHTAVDWCNFIHDICGLWMTDHSAPIGGP